MLILGLASGPAQNLVHSLKCSSSGPAYCCLGCFFPGPCDKISFILPDSFHSPWENLFLFCSGVSVRCHFSTESHTTGFSMVMCLPAFWMDNISLGWMLLYNYEPWWEEGDQGVRGDGSLMPEMCPHYPLTSAEYTCLCLSWGWGGISHPSGFYLGWMNNAKTIRQIVAHSGLNKDIFKRKEIK